MSGQIGKPRNTGMTVWRIVMVAVLLTFTANVALISIELGYADSILKSVNSQQNDVIIDQFQQNVMNQLNDINNLMLLLQTPEYINYFRDVMHLRDPDVAELERRKLVEKLEALQLSPDIIQSIYFIGENENQESHQKLTVATHFTDLPHLHTDALYSAGLMDLFLSEHNQFVRYNRKELAVYYDERNPMLSEANRHAISKFLSDIQDKMIITNGNVSKVFIVMVLNDHLFERLLPENLGSSHYTVMDERSEVLWSTSSDRKLLQAAASGAITSRVSDRSYVHLTREIPAYQLRVVYSSEQPRQIPFTSDLLFRMLGFSFAALGITLVISLVYLKQVFKPFRTISGKLHNKLVNEKNQTILQPIPEDLIKKGFQSISVRSKLIILFCIAVSIPSALNGVIYSELITREVEGVLDDSIETLGELSVVSIANQVAFLENTANQIAVSQQFHDYLSEPYTGLIQDYQYNLSMFPGLNEVSYFVLLDEYGEAIYSSIYSNNKDIFKTSPHYLEDRDDPYWITNYKDIFDQVSIAVIRRIELESSNNRVTYLLMVPKKTIFRIAQSEEIQVAYSITDRLGKPVDRFSILSSQNSLGQHRYVNMIPGTDWTIEIHYTFNEVMMLIKAFQKQYLLSIVIVFMLAAGIAVLIAGVLTKPIKLLKESMVQAAHEGMVKPVPFDAEGEIAGIVKSYNRMVERLNHTIQENMRIMEENARNKIREQELLSMKTQAELNMLQAQINPHFLYNTLETINMMSIRRGDTEISSIVNALADLLRYSVSKGTDTALLDRELKHAANYIKIQQARFGNSFEAEFDVPDELRQYPVLRFILQPIIENSIKHGFAGWESGGKIVVSARKDGDHLVIRVRDNGVGMDKRTLDALKEEIGRGLKEWKPGDHGIGLKNVFLRMKLFYGDRMSMDIKSGLMKGTEVMFRIPV
mgnify:CR=1 FL=1